MTAKANILRVGLLGCERPLTEGGSTGLPPNPPAACNAVTAVTAVTARAGNAYGEGMLWLAGRH